MSGEENNKKSQDGLTNNQQNINKQLERLKNIKLTGNRSEIFNLGGDKKNS